MWFVLSISESIADTMKRGGPEVRASTFYKTQYRICRVCIRRNCVCMRTFKI